ncbi:Uncharacterized membrane protein [Desulfonauticus submarinus]|uniref:Uncharacterized membrane protein n=1 Tax=Desulfonauticus submarinus TaxID=206665 RepID=A0A1H0EMJ3_9BACT|nr:DUF1614 domain-containing protein [Desulfonauticus submarinus]SDN83582.1 Uncharacterized membrane protein [Desulfonauticus submarinus]
MFPGPFFYFPFFFIVIFIFFLIVFFLFGLIKIGAIVIAFSKLGLSGWQVFWLLILTLIGSGINLPLLKRELKVYSLELDVDPFFRPFFRHVRPYPYDFMTKHEQVIALNIGGGLIPLLLSIYFIFQIGVTINLGICFLIVAFVCYKLARPIAGVGIGIPFLIPPLVTVLVTWLFAPKDIAPQVAYISGTLGTLIGADVLHLLDPREQDKLVSPVLSIGGAGTFDGIFLCGILAVLFA